MESKERTLTEIGNSERISRPEITDVRPSEAPLPREVKTWLEALEEDPSLNNPVINGQGQTVMKPSAPVDPKIVLPVTRTSFASGFKKTIDDAGKWLSVFIFRLIKIKGTKVTFKSE